MFQIKLQNFDKKKLIIIHIIEQLLRKKQMNYWDTLPKEIQTYISQISLVMLIEKTWTQNPKFRAKSIASSLMSQPHGIHIICPDTADKLEFCAKYSGKMSQFWIEFCMKVLEALILDMWSTDMGHGWIDRCCDAHETLIQKYDIRANKDDNIVGNLSYKYYTDGSFMTMENIELRY